MTKKTISRTLKIARTGILMAIVFAVQFVLLKWAPASVLTTIATGSIVNLVLLLALRLVGYWGSALIAVLTPIMAFLQGKLPIALLIPIVGLSNLVIITTCFFCGKMFLKMCDTTHNTKLWYATETMSVVAGTLLKFGFMILSISTYVPLFPGMKPPMVAALSISWSYPQVIAGIVGGVLAMFVYKALLRAGAIKEEKKKDKNANVNADVVASVDTTVTSNTNSDASSNIESKPL